MQFFGVMSFLSGIICMFLIYKEEIYFAQIMFAICMILFAISLIISLFEIQKSTNALELELSDMEGLDDGGIVDYIKKKLDK